MNRIVSRLEMAKGILFDLDNTLYPRDRGVFDHINSRINEYVSLATGKKGREVDLLRKEYLSRYGTTLGGLIHNHSVDADEYLDFVHHVPVEELLQPDPALISFLRSIKLPLVIFTNGTRSHAERVLAALGIEPYFDGICDLAATAYLGKPHREAFETAAGFLECALDCTIFIDDLPVNVEAGAAAGAFTVHVDGKGEEVGDLRVGCVKELEPLFSPMSWYQKSVNRKS
jgi:putative hydrolase of the HAD superfamily